MFFRASGNLQQVFAGSIEMEAEGLITNRCRVSVKETMDQLEANLGAMGLTIFARIDHAKGAADIGRALRPTEVLIFGSAKGGTPR